MKNFIVVIALFGCCCNLLAQNNCTTPIALGTLGAPGACGTGIVSGAITTVAGTNIGVTGSNPYNYLVGCGMASPAVDVWYTFVDPPNGYGANITVNGGTLANPNIALYNGTSCATLTGLGCIVGSGNTATLNVPAGLIPGQTYYIQVSGNTGETGTYNLGASVFQNCTDCLNAASFTANPLPVNGTYQPGQTVSFCFHVDAWTQTNNNWLHGVQLAFGPAWDLTTLTTTPPAPYMSTSANWGGNIPTCGYWAYYPAGVTSSANGSAWPAGFYFNGTYTQNILGMVTGCGSDADGDPGNNFGDGISNPGLVITPPANQWDFCFTITVLPGCNPGASLIVTVNTSGDGESGAWTNTGCSNDPATVFSARVSCCPPNMASTPTCTGTSAGSVTATPVGSAGPYTYTWAPGGQQTNPLTGVQPGAYTVTVVDVNLCSATATTTVAAEPLPVPTAGAAVAFCTGNNATLGGAATAGYTYAWSPTIGLSSSTAANPTVTLTNLTTNPVTTAYTVTATITATGCTGTASVNVTVNPAPSPTATNTGPYCPQATIQLNATGGTGYAWSGPNAFASAQQNPAIPNATTLMGGAYPVTVTDANGCTAIASTTVVINNTPSPTATNTGPYCLQSTIQLNATGGIGYAWSGPNGFNSAQQNPTQANATALMAGLYTVTVTSANSCTATASTTVVINAALSPVVTNTGPYCVGATIQLNAAGGVGFAWSGPNAFNSVSQNPSITGATAQMAGTYTVTATDASNCTGTGSTTVVINPLPAPTATNTGPYCVNGNIQLNATGGTSYAWSGPNAFSSAVQNPSIATATLAMNGTYTVSVTDANGCTATTTTAVVVATNLSPVVTNTGPYCAGGTVQLNENLGTTFTWSGPNAYSSNTQNPSIAGATTIMSGIYDVTVTDATGCTGTGATTVVVNPLPTPTATNTGPYCPNATIQLNANGGTGYSWNGPSAFSSAVQNPAIANAAASMAGAYNVTVTDVNGCTATASTSVVVNPLPVVNAGAGPNITCANPQVNLAAAPIPAGDTYAWAGPGIVSGGTTATPTVNAPGTYILTVTDANSCTASGNVVVTATITPPGANAGPSGLLTCIVSSVTLTASSTTPAATFVWSNGTNTAANTVSTVNTYTVTVTDPATGCTSSATTAVTSNTTAPDANAGPDEIITCISNMVSLAGSSTTANAVYNWSGPGVAGGATTASPSVNATGTYTVVVTDPLNGCTASASTNVTQALPPTVTAALTNNPCPQIAIGQIDLQVLGGQAPYTFSWSNNANTQNISGLRGGRYSITVTDVYGCFDTATYVLTEGTFKVTAQQDTTIKLGESTQLTGLATGGTGQLTYIWEPSYNLSCQLCQATVATPYVTIVYVLQATDSNGCSGYDTVTVTVIPIHDIFVPNAFTPNGDGNNDVFRVYGRLDLLQFFEVLVFDRLGEKVFESNNPEFTWDGTYKGVLENPAVFVYVIKATFLDGYTRNNYKGSVTLIR